MLLSNSLFGLSAILLSLVGLAVRPVDGIGQLSVPTTISLEERDISPRENRHYFHIQVYRTGRRYHSSKGSWIAFRAGDGHVVDDVNEAAKFYIFAGQLITSSGRYVHLEFSNGYAVFKWETRKQDHGIYYRHKRDWLQIFGPDFSYGKGEGVCCVGNDGALFVERNRGTPFQCHPLDMRPNPGTNPLPPPTNKPRPPKPRPTTTTTEGPRPTTTRGPWPTTTKNPRPTTTTGTTITTTTSRGNPSTSGTTWTSATTTTSNGPNPSWDPDPDMVPRSVEVDLEDDDHF